MTDLRARQLERAAASGDQNAELALLIQRVRVTSDLMTLCGVCQGVGRRIGPSTGRNVGCVPCGGTQGRMWNVSGRGLIHFPWRGKKGRVELAHFCGDPVAGKLAAGQVKYAKLHEPTHALIKFLRHLDLWPGAVMRAATIAMRMVLDRHESSDEWWERMSWEEGNGPENPPSTFSSAYPDGPFHFNLSRATRVVEAAERFVDSPSKEHREEWRVACCRLDSIQTAFLCWPPLLNSVPTDFLFRPPRSGDRGEAILECDRRIGRNEVRAAICSGLSAWALGRGV